LICTIELAVLVFIDRNIPYFGAFTLDNRVDHIEAARLRAINSDGKFTKVEQHRINHRLNNTSRAIYRAKHN
jgi:hypothetical protein